jgi:signal transduction histidine kinase/DNA-binding NarL/FixJ family response regulator
MQNSARNLLPGSSCVLLIEADDADANAVIGALKTSSSGAMVTRAVRLSEGLLRMAEGGVDAVVLDLSLPDASGLSGLRCIRAQAPAIPVLVLTGMRDESLCAQALHEGAQDYLVKGDLDGPSVARRIRDAFERQHYFTRAAIIAEEQAKAALAEHLRATWVADAGRLLASSLDYETTLANIGRTVVPGFADGCTVLASEGQRITVGLAFAEPGILEQVLRSGVPWVRPDSGALAVPMMSGDRCTGVLAFTLAPERAHFSQADLLLGEDLGHRAALALANASLYRQANAAVALREEFLSIASHELRTPLSTLQMQVQILQLKLGEEVAPTRDELLKRLASCASQTARVSRLVDTLLDVTLIASGQISLRREQLDLRRLVRDTVDRLRSESSSSATLLFDQGAELLTSGDRLRLEQVVTNLITNGVKYGNGKAVQVTLNADRGHAFLSVRDDGIGIAPPDLDRIFGRFERAASSRHYSGLGLGLYVTRQIVEAHGGTIRVESEPGVGSVFTVTLPLAPDAR